MGLRTFTFGGTSSSTYSMFITEAATYNVPERAVEMLEIPGRNGAYALDQGRFENVEVTYHVVVHKDTNANFQTELSSVRNWLASKVGYQRLTDDYNSNVYRMAIFKGGLETDETFVNGAEFDIVFECKPQRWLTSGETATAVANNGTLSNPTLFDSEPLLAVKGYGTIGFNGYEVELDNVTIGEVFIQQGYSAIDLNVSTPLADLNFSALNVGDTILLKSFSLAYRFEQEYVGMPTPITSFTISDSNTSFHSEGQTAGNVGVSVVTTVDNLSFVYGTDSTITNTTTLTCTINGTPCTWTRTYYVKYYASNNKITFDRTNSFTPSGTGFIRTNGNDYTGDVYGISTVSALGNPTYIDCDIGECYMIKNSEIVSLNQHIDLGSDLPVLASGTNTFTYDNTVTELKVTPRWWKV